MIVKLPISAKESFISFLSTFSITKSDYIFKSNGRKCSFTFKDSEDKRVLQMKSKFTTFLMVVMNDTTNALERRLKNRYMSKINDLKKQTEDLQNSLKKSQSNYTNALCYLEELQEEVESLKKFQNFDNTLNKVFIDVKTKWPGKKTSRILEFIKQRL
jgi:uncharacterized protein YlxW (UPF0749 family)